MKTLILCLIIEFSISSFSLSQNIDNSTCWEASTNYKTTGFTNRFYKVRIAKDSIKISINSEFNYIYKIFQDKKKRCFFMDGEKYVIEKRNENYLKIMYKNKKLRKSVNEIVTLDFKKCLQ